MKTWNYGKHSSCVETAHYKCAYDVDNYNAQ